MPWSCPQTRKWKLRVNAVLCTRNYNGLAPRCLLQLANDSSIGFWCGFCRRVAHFHFSNNENVWRQFREMNTSKLAAWRTDTVLFIEWLNNAETEMKNEYISFHKIALRFSEIETMTLVSCTPSFIDFVLLSCHCGKCVNEKSTPTFFPQFVCAVVKSQFGKLVSDCLAKIAR